MPAGPVPEPAQRDEPHPDAGGPSHAVPQLGRTCPFGHLTAVHDPQHPRRLHQRFRRVHPVPPGICAHTPQSSPGSWCAHSCGHFCGRSRVVNTHAAAHGGTSRDGRPADPGRHPRRPPRHKPQCNDAQTGPDHARRPGPAHEEATMTRIPRHHMPGHTANARGPPGAQPDRERHATGDPTTPRPLPGNRQSPGRPRRAPPPQATSKGDKR